MNIEKGYDFSEEIGIADYIESMGYDGRGDVITIADSITLLDAAVDIRWLIENVERLLKDKDAPNKQTKQ